MTGPTDLPDDAPPGPGEPEMPAQRARRESYFGWGPGDLVIEPPDDDPDPPTDDDE